MTLYLVLILVLIGWIKYKSFFNLLTWLVVIFSLHNLVYFWLSNNDVPISWIAPTNLSDNLFVDVHFRNIINLLVLSVVVLSVHKERNIVLILPNMNVIRLIYIFMVLPSILYYLVYENFEYGSGQSLDSSGSFSPLKRIIDLRYFILIYLIIGSHKVSKGLIVLILIELGLSFISGARKPLALVLGSIIYMQVFNKMVSMKRLAITFFSITLSAWYLLFINVTRGLRGDFQSKLSHFSEVLNDFGYLVLSKLAISMSSEGVQVWSAQLIDSGALKMTWGLTFLHAILNTIILRPFQGSFSNYQAAYLFKSVAYPGVDNQGWDYTFAAEAFLNFGDLGFIFYGLFFYVLSKGLRSRKALIKLISTFMLIGIIVYFRTDMTSFLRAVSYMVVIYYLGFFLRKLIKHDTNIT